MTKFLTKPGGVCWLYERPITLADGSMTRTRPKYHSLTKEIVNEVVLEESKIPNEFRGFVAFDIDIQIHGIRYTWLMINRAYTIQLPVAHVPYVGGEHP